MKNMYVHGQGAIVKHREELQKLENRASEAKKRLQHVCFHNDHTDVARTIEVIRTDDRGNAVSLRCKDCGKLIPMRAPSITELEEALKMVDAAIDFTKTRLDAEAFKDVSNGNPDPVKNGYRDLNPAVMIRRLQNSLYDFNKMYSNMTKSASEKASKKKKKDHDRGSRVISNGYQY